jgi:DDE domain
MSVLFNHAIRYEWLEQGRNPIMLVRQSALRKDTPAVLEPHESRGLLLELDQPFRLMVLLDVTTGLRRSELFALKWSDIDFWNLVIEVRRSICEGVVGNCKTGIVRLTGKDAMKLLTLHTALMRTYVSLYHRHRFPAEIISHCAWLYFRFALSFRDVEEMLAMHGVALTYETVREWCLKLGQTYANGLRHKSPRPGDRWHLDEVFLKINGRLHYLWRAVDQDG